MLLVLQVAQQVQMVAWPEQVPQQHCKAILVVVRVLVMPLTAAMAMVAVHQFRAAAAVAEVLGKVQFQSTIQAV
jgi:hypothetical protein